MRRILLCAAGLFVTIPAAALLRRTLPGIFTAIPYAGRSRIEALFIQQKTPVSLPGLSAL
jgi:hypothetical protein